MGTVKAWVVRELGGPEVLTLETFEPPPPAEGLVRIAVEAAAVNFFDSLQIAGSYQVKPELPFVPGTEVAGTVVAAPVDSGFNPRDRVLARLAQNGLLGGGYSELVDALPELTVRLPDGMPFDEAAGFFVNYQTGWFGLMRRARLQPGEVVLVHAGAGGVGSAAIQLAKAAGARVVATAGSAEKVALCGKLGADLAIDYRTEDFVEAVKGFTGGRGADVVYDPVGGDVESGCQGGVRICKLNMFVAAEELQHAHVVQAHEGIGRVVRNRRRECIARACRDAALAGRQHAGAQALRVSIWPR